MDSYKEELLNDIEMYARDNKEQVSQWLADAINGQSYAYDHIMEIADELTGNDDGSYYCNAYKAKEAVERNDLLTDEDFLQYVRDNETHLEDIIEKGWEAVDTWGRCYVLECVLTEDETIEALKRGL